MTCSAEARRWMFSATLAFCVAACDGPAVGPDGGSPDAGVDAPVPLEPALSARDQILALSTMVTLDALASDRASWIAIADASGILIGLAPLEPGRYEGMRVALDRRVLAPETLRATLHADLGVAGTFEPDGDLLLAEASFSVEADELTPAVEISVLNIGDHSWTFNAAEPSRYAVTPDPTATNPSIALRRGWRYQVFNAANVSHPFELIDVDDGGEDVVLLSQRVDGVLDDDPSVAFEITSPAFFRFTVSPALEERLDTYRCLIHPDQMRGPATTQAAP